MLALPSLAATSTHVVQRGETLSGIAYDHGVSTSALVEANSISNRHLIYVGQELAIPGAPLEPSAPAEPAVAERATYVVQRGDTLGGIAYRHGISIAALAAANSISNPHHIVAGRSLVIPVSGAAPAAPSPGSTPSTPASSSSSGPPQGPHPVPTHVVQPGESLGGIAARYGTSTAAVAEANGIIDPTELFATVRLFVSARVTNVPTPGGAASSGGSHTIRSGETLETIARSYGTSIRALAEANGISNPNRIAAGQSLSVPGSSGGGWICPMTNPIFFNDWGFPRSGGRYHEGNDLFGTRGSPIVAPVSGVVTQATGSRAGLQATLAGDDGYTYIFTHLGEFGASGRVSAGTQIGTVGTSGNAAGSSPHTHFEMHPGRVAAVNPYPTLAEHCR